MYRQRPEQMESESELKPLFLSRLFCIPVVATAVDQMNALYSATKERNSLMKRTMEGAETGVSAIIGTAAPVVHMFDKPLTSLDGFACDQLAKLEKKYPIITKPTDEVVKATRDLCNTSVKPFVDRVSSAKQFGYDRVSNVRSFTGEKLGDVKTYGWTTVGSVVQLGNDQWSRVLTTVGGRQHLPRVTDLLDTADRYVDSYLPPDEEEGEVKEKQEGGDGEMEDGREDVVISKAVQLGSKVQKRVWSQAVKQMKRVQLRSRETIHKLNFTVDLIEYARRNLNGAKDKVGSIWIEVNKTDEEVAEEEMNEEPTTNEEETTKKKKKSGLERRAIATARQLTLQLKKTLSWIRIPHGYGVDSIPDVVMSRMKVVQEKAQSLVDIFSKEVVDGMEMTESGLARARNLTSQIYSGLFDLVSQWTQFGRKQGEVNVTLELEEQEMDPIDETDDQLLNNTANKTADL